MIAIDEWAGEIHRGDAFELIQEVPANSVDCIVTSPPYWGTRDYEVAGQIGLEEHVSEYVDRLTSLCGELQRVLKQRGGFHLNLGDTYNTDSIVRKQSGDRKIQAGDERQTGIYANPEFEQTHRREPIDEVPERSKLFVPHRIAIELTRQGWIARNDIPWVKPAGGLDSATDRYRNRFEYFFYFTLSTENYFQPSQALYDVFEDRPSRSSGHTASYPPRLIRPAIEATCPEGGVVLDPFAGSGTTCVAAKNVGRQYVGFELKGEYVSLARDRLDEAGDVRLTAYSDGGFTPDAEARNAGGRRE